MLGKHTRHDPDLREILLGFRGDSSAVEPLRVALRELAKRREQREGAREAQSVARGGTNPWTKGGGVGGARGVGRLKCSELNGGSKGASRDTGALTPVP